MVDYAASLLAKLPAALRRDRSLERLLSKLRTYLPEDQVDMIVRAYDFGAAAHEGQTRKTGEPYITFFNNSSVATTVGLIGKYVNASLPDLITSVQLAPFESRTFDAVQLGIVPNQTVGLRYDATTNVTVLAASAQGGDSDATQASTHA